MRVNPLSIDDLPDLILRLRRDGTILDFAGGFAVQSLRLARRAVGESIEGHWPRQAATLIKQLARRAIASRGRCEAGFMHDGTHYEARANAESPECAICVIRTSIQEVIVQDALRSTEDPADPRFDRRAFWRRFSDTFSTASLSGRPMTVAIIHLDGLDDIAQLMDTGISDRIISTVMQRVTAALEAVQSEPVWYIGQASDYELVLVIESTVRDVVEDKVMQVRNSLSGPIHLGDALFQLRPYVGAALLGQDATMQGALIDNARAATTEARRRESSAVCFFSDTMKLRSLTRMDLAQELSDAIANRDIRLRYRGRYDFSTGNRLALVGYLQWNHPVRGEIRPSYFLRIAAATGQTTTLSRSLLQCLREDFHTSGLKLTPEVRISYGALRHHVLEDAFVADIAQLLADQIIAPERLELRISERTYVAKSGVEWRSFVDAGVQLVVDEVGRDVSSIDRLARAPLWGLQLDRSCAVGALDDPAAARVCSAVAGVARSLGLVPIATGIDSKDHQSALQDLGYVQGIGDLYDAPRRAVVANARSSVNTT